MRNTQVAWILLLLFMCAVVQPHAQESKVDPVQKFAEVKAKADSGDSEAQLTLGHYYEMGFGVGKNAKEAVENFRKSAERGNAQAQSWLGQVYEYGGLVTKDGTEAAKWYRKAAEQGNWLGQVGLGNCYTTGNGVSKDAVEAVKWYRKAAEQGSGIGQQCLGYAYFFGGGVATNYIEAYKWLKLAADGGQLDPIRKLTVIEQQLSLEQMAEAQKSIREYKLRSASKEHESRLRPTSSGSGFFITEDGFLVTNEHVIRDNAGFIALLTSAGSVVVKLVKVDAANDLALLKAEGRFAALPVAASRGVKLGGTVATVGFPNIGLQGFAPKLAKGEIASLSGAGDDARYFQISVPVQPGNSGGALVDERGNVVGVVSAKLNASAALAMSGTLPENVNYAVKSSYLLSFLESVPDVASKLKEASGKEKKFEEVVKEAEQAAVLVLVY